MLIVAQILKFPSHQVAVGVKVDILYCDTEVVLMRMTVGNEVIHQMVQKHELQGMDTIA